MARLLTIPTGMRKLSLEERRAPGEDDDIIPLDDAPAAEPVVDAGTGTGGDAAQAENADAIAASTSPEAPAAAEADPASDAAADSSVTDAPSEPAAGDDAPPPAAGDDAPAPDTGTADVPAEPTPDAPAETGTEGAPEPAAEPAGDIAPVPDDITPAAPADTVNEPAAEASVTDAPAIDPATDVPAAPAGEEQAAAVVDGASDAAAAVDSPVDAGVDPVAPADTATDPVDSGFPEDVAPEADVSAPGDVASDAAPVEGTAPVTPEGDISAAPAGVDTAADLSADTVPGDASADPASDVAAPADGATDPAATEPAEPIDPVADVEPEEMTSAWVDGVAVDAEEVKQQIEDAANDVADADNVTEELEDAAVALEELAAKVSENLAEENPVVSDTTVNLVKITADKTLHHIGEVVDLPASMESAATPHQRLSVTLEAIGEKLKEIWEAIKRALLKAWEAVVTFFKTIFDSAHRTKAAVEKLLKAVKAMGTDAPEQTTITNASVVAGVNFDGFKSTKDYLSAIAQLDKVMGPYLENSKAGIGNVISASADILKKMAIQGEHTSDTSAYSAMDKAVDAFEKVSNRLVETMATGAEKHKASGGVNQTKSGPLPGGFRVYAIGLESSGSSWQDILKNMGSALSRSSIKVDIAYGDGLRIEHDPVKGESLPVATRSEMEAVLVSFVSLLDSVIASKDSVAQFERDIKGFNSEMDLVVKQAKDNGIDFGHYCSMLAKLGPSLVKINSRLIGMTVTIASNGVKYVTASAKAHPSFGSSVDGEAKEVAPKGAPQLAAPATA